MSHLLIASSLSGALAGTIMGCLLAMMLNRIYYPMIPDLLDRGEEKRLFLNIGLIAIASYFALGLPAQWAMDSFSARCGFYTPVFDRAGVFAMAASAITLGWRKAVTERQRRNRENE